MSAAYDYRDHPESPETPTCDACSTRARWSIAQPKEWPDDGKPHIFDFNWTIEAFACGRHLHRVMDRMNWDLDVLEIYDLARFPDGGC